MSDSRDARAKLPKSAGGAPRAVKGSSAAAPATRPQQQRVSTQTGRAPASSGRGGAPRRSTPRRVRLTLSRVDTWSVLKIAFLLSVAVAIASVVLVATLWTVLAGVGTFSAINDLLRTLDRQGSKFDILDYLGFGRSISFSIVIGVLNIILMTAIATLSAFLYNICASLVGGVQLTLSDE